MGVGLNKKGITKRLIGQNEIYFENHRQSSNFQFIERALSNSSMDFCLKKRTNLSALNPKR